MRVINNNKQGRRWPRLLVKQTRQRGKALVQHCGVGGAKHENMAAVCLLCLLVGKLNHVALATPYATVHRLADEEHERRRARKFFFLSCNHDTIKNT